MSGAIAMIEFTPEAEARLADYLRQVRAALAGAADVNPDEIEADIREHVENELRRAAAPVASPRRSSCTVACWPRTPTSSTASRPRSARTLAG